MADDTSGKIPVAECVKEAYAFLYEHWKTFLPAAAAIGVLASVSLLVVGSALLELATSLVGLLLGLAYTASILRKQIRNEAVGPLGLTVGAEEFRLLGANLAIGLMFMPVLFVGAITLSVILVGRLGLSPEALETLSDDPEAFRLALVEVMSPGDIVWALVFLIPLLILAAKFFLVNPAIIGERRMVLLQTWRWTDGNVWRVVAAMVLVSGPFIAITIATFLFMAGWSSSLAAGGGGNITLVVGIGLASCASAIARLPLLALSGILYSGLRPSSTASR